MHGGNYIKEARDSAKSTCLIFSPKEEDQVGSLGNYLQLFAVSKIKQFSYYLLSINLHTDKTFLLEHYHLRNTRLISYTSSLEALYDAQIAMNLWWNVHQAVI